MLSKAIKHANWTLTNEYPPFYHVKKSTSKIVDKSHKGNSSIFRSCCFSLVTTGQHGTNKKATMNKNIFKVAQSSSTKLFWLFMVRFQMSLQIASLICCKQTLVACVLFFSTMHLQMLANFQFEGLFRQ